ncbi:polysaccharide biosynthesis protein [Ekhidna sp.]
MELAKQIAPECKIEIVGLRPGDKLHEEIENTSSADQTHQIVYGH